MDAWYIVNDIKVSPMNDGGCKFYTNSQYILFYKLKNL